MISLDALLSHAETLLQATPEAIEVNVLLTSGGQIFSIPVYRLEDIIDESYCRQQLRNIPDTKVDCILSMWRDSSCIDMPSYALRTQLLALNPDNRDTAVFLFGEHGIHPFPLARTMAPATLDRLNNS